MIVIMSVIYDRQTEKIVRIALSASHKDASEMAEKEIRDMLGSRLIQKPAAIVVPIQLHSDSWYARSLTLDTIRRAIERPDLIGNTSGAYVLSPDFEWQPLFEEVDDAPAS